VENSKNGKELIDIPVIWGWRGLYMKNPNDASKIRVVKLANMHLTNPLHLFSIFRVFHSWFFISFSYAVCYYENIS
jgi:hypothetical protein